jgi:hypothetical protein
MIVLYHRTNRTASRAIMRRGFKDTTGYYMIALPTSGVWVSDRPLDVNEGARGDILLRVTVRLGKRDLRKYEWVEEGKPYREWQLPAALINARRTSLVIIPPWREHLQLAFRGLRP